MHFTRGNTFKLNRLKYRAKLNTKILFSMRTINVWNSLPHDIVCSTSVNSFVKRLESVNILVHSFLRGMHVYSTLYVYLLSLQLK